MRRAWIVGLLLAAGCRAGGAGGFERFDLTTTPTAADYPDAQRVVLLDRGILRLGVDGETGLPLAQLERYRRVKLLRPDPEAARLALPCPPQTPIHQLQAHTIRPDGGVEAADALPDTRLPDGRVLIQRRFAAAEPGAVLEARWVQSLPDPRFLPAWVFEDAAPIERSELVVEAPRGFEVDLRLSRGGALLDVAPDRFETERGVRLSWTRTKLPAAPREPQALPAQTLAETAQPLFLSAPHGAQRVYGLRSWDEVGAWLLAKLPGWAQLPPSEVRRAKALTDGRSPVEAAIELAALIARLIPPAADPPPLWRAPLQRADQTLRSQRANPTTRGLLLVAWLRAIGVDAQPALYAGSGVQLTPDFPAVRALAGVAAAVKTPAGIVVVDPSQYTLSPRVPPPALQGARVVLVDAAQAWTEKLPSSRPEDSRSQLKAKLQMDPMGALAGQAEATLTGAEAGQLRAALARLQPEAYPAAVTAFFQARGLPARWLSVSIQGLPSLTLPLHLSGELERPAPATPPPGGLPTGAVIGPAPRATRQLRRGPVYLGAPHSLDLQVQLRLPAGHRLAPPPPPVQLQSPAGQTSLSVQALGPNQATLTYRAVVSARLLPLTDYPRYRHSQQALQRALDVPLTLPQPSDPVY